MGRRVKSEVAGAEAWGRGMAKQGKILIKFDIRYRSRRLREETDMETQLLNGFWTGAKVRAQGIRPPGDGFIILEGEVRPNYKGDYYHDSPNVVLVRGSISPQSHRRPRDHVSLGRRGVYFHRDDVHPGVEGKGAEGKGAPDRVAGQNAELAQIADALDEVAGECSHGTLLDDTKRWGRKIRRLADRARKLADGN